MVAVIAVGGCDVVTNRYNTLQDARNDRLFERGWLPDILPRSSYNIRTSNDVDSNTSDGEFRFPPDEFSSFSQSLAVYAGRPSPLAQLPRDLERLESAGYEAYEFSTDDSVWVFICKAEAGRCEYRMWESRN